MDQEQAEAFIRETRKYGMVYGLESIRSLMARLGNVQDQLRILHVAGTNGKGSVCAMLAGILQAAGYRTGVYSSPAVFEPEEIIKVDGKCISREAFAELAGKVQTACTDLMNEGLRHPTAFEAETAIAFCYFKQEACEYVVLEAGLGGAEDATNLIMHPLCSILTSISMDHMGILGHTLEEIAAAKAGIMKPGCPCVSSVQKPEAVRVLQRAAAKQGSELRIADTSCIRSFSYHDEKSCFEVSDIFFGLQTGAFCQAEACQEQQGMTAQAETCQEQQGMAAQAEGDLKKVLKGTLGLTGACQKENLACVLEVVKLLRKKGVRITREALLTGLADVRLPGRFEKISREPDFYIDGAHNEGAALCLRETVRECLSGAGRRIVYIIGVFADKEYEKLLRIMLPDAAQVFTVTPDHPRALSGKTLAQLAGTMHPAVSYVPDLAQAAGLAAEAAGAGGAVVAFGSFSYLKALKAAVKIRSRQS